jgi:DNA-binding NarL/FixJ family response regulator
MSTLRIRAAVADDHPGFRQVFQEVLSQNYDVVGTAADGRELLLLVQEHNPDLVVLDVSMPVMNGFEVLEYCRANGLSARFVYCSSNGSRPFVHRALRLGAHGYVLKSALWEDLPAAVATVLDGGIFVSPAISSEA